MTDMCIAAANYLVELTNRHNESCQYSDQIAMSCKRLQKLLYFSEAEYQKRYAASMFDDDFYAWPSGPVIPSVYSRFAQFQTGKMATVEGAHTPLTQAMEEVLDYVFQKSKTISTSVLVDMSHADGGPWKAVYDENDPQHKQIIDKDAIYTYYTTHVIFA
ncbi:MAG: SocA family protein [Clostridia bacterium]|nr:SocA family protein [Clostridia bacterium]